MTCHTGEVGLLVVLVFVVTAGVFTVGDLRLSKANQHTRIPAFRRPTHMPANSKWLRASGGALCALLGAVASLAGLSILAAMSFVLAAVAPSLVIFIAHNRRVARGT